MNIEDVFWLAGLLEGEGCFRFSRTPHIILQMTDEDVIRKAAFLINSGKYRSRAPRIDGRKVVFTTEAFGGRALELMKLILPYMGDRRTAKINEVMAAASSRLGVAKGERCGQAKLKDSQVSDLIREYRENPKWGAQSNLARKYGVSTRTVNYMVRGKSYAHLVI